MPPVALRRGGRSGCVVSADHIKVSCCSWAATKRGDHHTVIVNAGRPKTVHVVPPAGEDHAFDRQDWPVEVQVSVSPTGRSVSVFVNGKKVHP
jgi:hypothetical protein